jgi:DNA polymerase-3 subunit beta
MDTKGKEMSGTKETIINARYYIEAGAFVTKEVSRYSLVRVEPHPDGGAVIVATDGHTMGVFHDREGKCDEPVTIAFRPEIARLAKAKRGTIRQIRVNGDLDIVQPATRKDVARTLVRFFDAVVTDNSQFPSWRSVMPSATEAVKHSTFNGNYLARCALAKQEYRNEGIAIFQKDATTQAVIRTSRDDFVGIVMPMRVDGLDTPYPKVFQPFLTPKPKAAEPREEAKGRAES